MHKFLQTHPPITTAIIVFHACNLKFYFGNYFFSMVPTVACLFKPAHHTLAGFGTHSANILRTIVACFAGERARDLFGFSLFSHLLSHDGYLFFFGSN
jgi:hypothetical protein